MTREMLGGKIHSARVTQVNLEYEGSCAIDEDLLDAANIRRYERVHIYNMNSGTRFDTYAIPGKRGSGIIGLNGAAARLGHLGDRVIIVSFVQVSEEKLTAHKPTVVVVDEKNRPVKNKRHSIRRKA
jgi:aspartate 1-decarboxylase